MRKHSHTWTQRKAELKRARSARRTAGRKTTQPTIKRCTQAQAAAQKPTEESSGFLAAWNQLLGAIRLPVLARRRGRKPRVGLPNVLAALDRKSTRLNSSHGYISYAVFCLKKKKKLVQKGRSANLRD